jgi:hypothetical protein
LQSDNGRQARGRSGREQIEQLGDLGVHRATTPSHRACVREPANREREEDCHRNRDDLRTGRDRRGDHRDRSPDGPDVDG